MFDISERLVPMLVLVGGPCSGKSAIIRRLSKLANTDDIKCVFVPEAATKLHELGRPFDSFASPLEYQIAIAEMQLELEDESISHAMSLGPGYVVVCDRGICDAPAYVDQEGYAKVLETIGISKKEAEARYDRICFRNSLAVSLPEVYAEKTESNPARHESPELAAKLNAATLDAWRSHPGFETLPADGVDAAAKRVEEVIREISVQALSRFEIERKFLIARPDTGRLSALPGCKTVRIVQTYLDFDGGESRVRRKEENDKVSYIQTTKRPSEFGGLVRFEEEREISESEYRKLLELADPTCLPVEKTRYVFTVNEQTFEVDVYNGWKKYAILEAELPSQDAELELPGFLGVVREVTGNPRFSNRTISENLPDFPA